jgi:hypothetical protein
MVPLPFTTCFLIQELVFSQGLFISPHIKKSFHFNDNFQKWDGLIFLKFVFGPSWKREYYVKETFFPTILLLIFSHTMKLWSMKRMQLNMIYHAIRLLFFQHTIYIEHIFQLDNWEVVEQNIHLKCQKFHNDSIINMVWKDLWFHVPPYSIINSFINLLIEYTNN